MSNQFSGWFDDHDTSIRPGWIFVVLSMPGLMALAMTLGILGILPRRPGSGPSDLQVYLVAIPLDLVLLAFLAWVIYGWVCGFVPFVADPPDAPLADQSPLPLERPVRIALTGIVALAVPTIRRRYRSRPGYFVLRGSELNFLLNRWRTEYFGGTQRSFAAVASLDRESVSDVVRGTAYLVSKELPALRLTTPQGPVLVTFAARNTRDAVFNSLEQMRLGSSLPSDPPLQVPAGVQE